MKVAPITSPPTEWRSPPEHLPLGRDEVHVWRASLDQPPSLVENFRLSLAADERARAQRLYYRRDREHFTVARGVLRAILGGYLNQEPASLSFCYSSHGKPGLAGHFDGAAIRFNVSHSHGIALFALTRGLEVGIDLERIRLDLAVTEVAARFFSRREVATLQALPLNLQRQAFFRCWTRKEAYIKARGEGLSLPLDQFDVSLAPGEPAALLAIRHDLSKTSVWSLQELDLAPDYVATLAVEAQGCRLRCWNWPSPGQSSF